MAVTGRLTAGMDIDAEDEADKSGVVDDATETLGDDAGGMGDADWRRGDAGRALFVDEAMEFGAGGRGGGGLVLIAAAVVEKVVVVVVALE